MFLDELKVIRKYILENLLKRFIKINLLFWATLILFIKKINNSFYFYVNYRKLNTIIKKDRYLLFFIEEILIKITKV